MNSLQCLAINFRDSAYNNDPDGTKADIKVASELRLYMYAYVVFCGYPSTYANELADECCKEYMAGGEKPRLWGMWLRDAKYYADARSYEKKNI